MINKFFFCNGLAALAILSSSCGVKSVDSKPKNIFGEDTRTELDTSKFPGSAVGRLDVGCTGAVIGKKLVLTAAHCVVDQAKGTLRDDVKLFKSGLKGDKSVAESWIVAAWVGSVKPDDSRKDDWAILLLADDIGTKTGWFGLKAIDTATELPYTLNSAGYATDKDQGGTPMVSKNCYIHKVDDAGRLLHDCDGVTGVSGGPMFVESGSDATIVAITVAEFRRGDQSMKLDTYTHALANIAVNAGSLNSVVDQIKPASDAGLSFPAVPGVTYIVNTGSNPGTGSGGNGNAPILPPQQNNQAAVVAKVTAQAYNIVNEANAILNYIAIIQNYAAPRNYPVLWNQAATLRTATVGLSENAYFLATGAVNSTQGSNYVVSHVYNVSASMKTFSDFFDSGAAVNPQVPYDLGATVYAMKLSMTRLVEMVSVQN